MKAIIDGKLKRLTKKEVKELKEEEALLRKSANGTFSSIH